MTIKKLIGSAMLVVLLLGWLGSIVAVHGWLVVLAVSVVGVVFVGWVFVAINLLMGD